MCFRTFVAIKVPWMFNFWCNKNTLNYQCHRSDVWHQYKKPDSVNQRRWLIKKQSHSLNDICVKFCYNRSISKNNILQPPTHIILFQVELLIGEHWPLLFANASYSLWLSPRPKFKKLFDCQSIHAHRVSECIIL